MNKLEGSEGLNMRAQTRRNAHWPYLALAMCATGIFGMGSRAAAQDGTPVALTLSQAIDLALKQNRSLKLAQLSVTDSEHKKEMARSGDFPHIKNESSILHVSELAGVEIPAGAFGAPAATGPIPSQSLFIDQGGLTSYTSATHLTQQFTQMFTIHESNPAPTAYTNTPN